MDKSTSLVMDAVQALFNAFVQSGRNLDTQKPTIEDGKVYAIVRYWGDWQMPQGEEDDGDYDWKELTDSSRAKAEAIVSAVQKRFPEVKLSASVEEKQCLLLRAKIK